MNHKNSHNLKEGDIVQCKCCYYKDYFVKGKTYTVTTSPIQTEEHEIYLIYPNKKIKFIQDKKFTTYFYTKDEIRKMKLEKLLNLSV